MVNNEYWLWHETLHRPMCLVCGYDDYVWEHNDRRRVSLVFEGEVITLPLEMIRLCSFCFSEGWRWRTCSSCEIEMLVKEGDETLCARCKEVING
jgi:hypothetical protein